MAVKPSTTDPDFVSPMLATATTVLPVGKWVAEEKFDGHRLIVARKAEGVKAWSRNGKERALTTRLMHALETLPQGVYDGELIVPHGYSSSVTDLSNSHLLQYVVFDLLKYTGVDMTTGRWSARRAALEGIFDSHEDNAVVRLADFYHVNTWKDVEELVDTIWERGGEGLILKDTEAPYRAGKRTKTFLKVKEQGFEVLTIIGFAPSEGEVMNYGDFGTAVLRNDQGTVVPVKVLDDEVRARLAKDDYGPRIWQEVRLLSGKKLRYHSNHSWVGKLLHIEYQCRTPDGSYRHPRWDRLDGE